LEPSFDGDVASEAAAALREAAFIGSDVLRGRRRRRRPAPALPVFSRAVWYAAYEAIHEAERRGVGPATAAHLAVGLLAVPNGAATRLATRLLQERCVPGHNLTAAIRADPDYRTGGRRPRGSVYLLIAYRVLPAQAPRLLRLPWQLAVSLFVGLYLRRPYRRCGARYGHPMLYVVEGTATYQAVRTGHARVTSADVLLSILDVDEQLASAGKALPEDVARWNQAGEILMQHGVTRQSAARLATQLGSAPADDEQSDDGVPTRGWWTVRTQVVGIPDQGRTALLALREASLSARRHGHPYAGTTHLLATLLAEASGPAARLLRQLHTDPEVIRAQALSHLESLSGTGSRQ
jgi:hypothetical protein